MSTRRCWHKLDETLISNFVAFLPHAHPGIYEGAVTIRLGILLDVCL